MINKVKILNCQLFIIVVLFVSLNSCKKGDNNDPLFEEDLAKVTTSEVTSITQTTATSGGYASLSSVGTPNVTARGVCWNTSKNPKTDNSKTTDYEGYGDFTSTLTGLTANTLYYVRAYVTNNFGTAYGNEVSFKTMPISNLTVTDIDGNLYHTVVIGTQTWMVENLKTTKLNDGINILNVTDNASWHGIYKTPAYCWYNNDISYKNTYGALYNWHVVNTGKLAPKGWHIPSEPELNKLINYLGGEEYAARKLKEIGTSHWKQLANDVATNESGFTGLPGGERDGMDGTFKSVGSFGFYWSTSEKSLYSPYCLDLAYMGSVGVYGAYHDDGLSVRCLKD